MKRIFILSMLVSVLFSCADNPVAVEEFEPEFFQLRIKEWGIIATHNSSSSNPDWNNRPGIMIAYSLLNDNLEDEDLMVEFWLIVSGARPIEDLATLFPIGTAPFLSETLGLICKETTTNLDPIDIIKDNIIRSGQRVFGISFDESEEGNPFNWKDWFSVWASVRIKAFTFESLSKGPIYEFKSEPIEVILQR